MRTEVMRGLALIVTTLIVAGCGPQPEPFPAATAEELKQLTDVTDRVLLLPHSSEPDAALGAALAALAAADRQYQQHMDAIRNRANVDAIACIHGKALQVTELQMALVKRDEAARRPDEALAKHYATLLMTLASDSGQCAALSVSKLVDQEERPEALQHSAVLISEIFAIWAVHMTAMDLQLAPLLKEQIRVYEHLVAKLGPKHEAPVVTDALPKLRAALASLETKPAL